MFQSSMSRFRSWWSAATEDLLGADLSESERPVDLHRNHPHRRPLGRSGRRRPGMVPARPAHCLSPVRPRHPVERASQPTSGI
jgi:hypothetical protein